MRKACLPTNGIQTNSTIAWVNFTWGLFINFTPEEKTERKRLYGVCL
jgi:hypothetical protein